MQQVLVNLITSSLLHMSRKKDQQYFVHNFDKLKCIFVFLLNNILKSDAKLPIQLLSALSNPNLCCENEMRAILHQNINWNYFKIISATLNMLENIHELQ